MEFYYQYKTTNQYLTFNMTSSQFVQSVGLLKLSCKDLESKDILSKSDPFVVVEMRSQSTADPQFVEMGRTETQKNNSNPEFQKTIEFPYCLHDNQELKFSVYDSDSKSTDLKKHDLIHTE